MKTWKQNLKHLTVEQYRMLRELCSLSRAVYNESLYNIRQHYFEEGSYLRYEANYYLVKNSNNYKRLGANVAQQSMKGADASFKSFFGLMKLAKSGKYQSWKIRMPEYLKKYAFFKIVFSQAQISDDKFRVPISFDMRKDYPQPMFIKIPPHIRDKKIRQIHIVPKYNGRYFEVRYMFDDAAEVNPELDVEKSMGIDLGVNNLATCVTNTGESFIIDGRKLKSINQWYNKELSRLSSIKDLQGIECYTKHQYTLTTKRNNRVNNYIYCAAKKIVKYCVNNKIGNIVVGYNDGFQSRSNLGKVNNQNFVMIPLGRLKSRIEYLCNRYGINFVQQEESYTSKASFFDKDNMPKWNPQNPEEVKFSGKRVHRGLYITSKGIQLNADVNAALNILSKSNLTDLTVLQASGAVSSPLRYKIVS